MPRSEAAWPMLSSAIIAAAVQQTHEAERTRTQVRALSFAHPGMTIDDGYAIQKEWVDLKIAEGRMVRGHKIGLTSRAMQLASQITEPDYGTLLDDMFFADGAEIPSDRFIVPMLEVELAFVLERRLAGPDCTLFDVLDATRYVTPALELIDARTFRIDPETKKPRRVVDTIADNAANAGIILGGRAIKPDDVDLRWVSALFYKNGTNRGNRRRGGRPQSSGQRHRVAREQTRRARYRARSRRDRSRGLLYAAGAVPCGRCVSCRLRTARRDHVPVRVRIR